jgi:hypothetical protein
MLTVDYNEEYPDVLPELSLEAVEGEARGDEIASLLNGLRTVVSQTSPGFLRNSTGVAQLPSFTGRGKFRDGHDIHTDFSSPRASLHDHQYKSRGEKGSGNAKRAA